MSRLRITLGAEIRAAKTSLLAAMLVSALLVTALGQAGVALGADPSVSPAAKDFVLRPGESTTFDVEVTTGSHAIPRVDVMLVFDVSGSMGDELDEAKRRGVSIMEAVRRDVPDSVFGVASLCDYPGWYDYPGYSAQYGSGLDYPWRLDQSPTADIAAAQRAINSLNLLHGEDGPEAYSRALYELARVSWRDSAKKIVVLFGDAPPHDLTFGGRNTGGDPGRDGAAQTADDLVFEQVVRELAAAGVYVLTVNCGGDSQAEEAFRHVASTTAGEFAVLSRASDLEGVTTRLIRDATSRIAKLELATDAAYNKWVRVHPSGGFADVGPDETKKFTVTVTVPSGSTGAHSFALKALADGAFLGMTAISAVARIDASTVFTAKTHGYTFKNASSSASWEAMEGYFGRAVCMPSSVDSGDVEQALWAARRLYEAVWKEAGDGGSCFGMSTSSVAIFEGWDEHALGKTTAADLDDPGTTERAPWWKRWFASDRWFNDTNVSRAISDYQARWGDPRACGVDYDQRTRKSTDVFDKLVAYLDASQPVVVTMWKYDASSEEIDAGHTVVAHGYTVEADSLRVRIYDNNHPGAEKVIQANRKSGAWTYSGYSGPFNSKDGKTRDTCISVMLAQAVKPPGVAPWNPAGGPGEDSGVLYLGGFHSVEALAAGAPLSVSPVPRSGVHSESPLRVALVPGKSELMVSASRETTYAADLDFFAPGTSLSLADVTAGSLTATMTATGSAHLSTADPGTYAYSASRETSGTSRVFELTDVQMDLGGDSFVPADDFMQLEFVNDGEEERYSATVLRISDTSESYGLPDLTIGEGDRHVAVVSSWEDMASDPPLLLVDIGNDGSIDETLTMQPIGGVPSSGGGGGGGSPGPMLAMFGLAFAGAIAWVLHSGRASRDTEGDASATLAVIGAPQPVGTLTASDGTSYMLREGEQSIGRSTSCDIVMAHPEVSRQHAVVIVASDGVWIADTGSTLGTLVNGVQVARAGLRDGDVVSIGPVELVFCHANN